MNEDHETIADRRNARRDADDDRKMREYRGNPAKEGIEAAKNDDAKRFRNDESTNLLTLILKMATKWYDAEISMLDTDRQGLRNTRGVYESRRDSFAADTKELCESLAQLIRNDGPAPDVVAALRQIVTVENIVNIKR